ncbi:MAG: TonB-dependent receptor plug domain-containing protein, partial [Myxococcales bacterium]|nr:TonB-dependent receptor plug domain-containing protein [Myxococcales bacterium]
MSRCRLSLAAAIAFSISATQAQAEVYEAEAPPEEPVDMASEVVDPDGEPVEDPDYETTTTEDALDPVWRGPTDRRQVSSQDLERTGATSLADALDAAGLGTGTWGGTTVQGLQVEGLPASQVTVTRDGFSISRMINTSDGPSQDVGSTLVNAASLDRVEMSQGVSPIGSGGTGGVAINLVSADVSENARATGSASVRTGAGGLLEQRYSAAAEAPFGEFSISGDADLSRRREVDVNADDVFDGPRRSIEQGSLALQWSPNSNEYLRIQGSLGHQVTDVLSNPSAPLYDSTSTLEGQALVTGQWWASRDLRIQHGLQYSSFSHDFEKVVRESSNR